MTQPTTKNYHRRTLLFAAARVQSTAATPNTNTPFRLVIVESPSKCKTIDKILNDYAQKHKLPFSYKVTSCYGHVRNLSKEKLPASSLSSVFPYRVPGIDLSQNYQPLYEIIESKQHVVNDLQRLSNQAQTTVYATDPDREGEAMAWHLQELLKAKHSERISFTEITPAAVLEAILPTHDDSSNDHDEYNNKKKKKTHQQEAPSSLSSHNNNNKINPHLVTAQETRRVLDRLVGFTLSPILWKKIAPGLSAGRVQSVGMALIVHRERQRLLFESTEYWSVEANLQGNHNIISAKLMSVNQTTVASSGSDFAPQGQRLVPSSKKLHLQQDAALELVTKLLQAGDWKVKSVESKQVKQQPPQPYRTSTLQQDASRKLGLSVDQTMRLAQELYEAGYISYMRTDSSSLSEPAEQAIQQAISKTFGNGEYYQAQQNEGKKHTKKKQAKFAQEAHEAIRPALQEGDTFALPEKLTGQVGDASIRLYQMIYKRTLACRMQPLISNRTRVIIEATDGTTEAEFRATGSVVVSPGYTAVYGTVQSEDDDDDKQLLPPLQEGQVLRVDNLSSIRHDTQPPPRYNEASFVKELEDLGVGRPSTYASTVKILRERAYVGSPLTDGGRGSSSNGKVVTGMAKVAQRAAGGEDFTGSTKGVMIPSVSAFVVCDLLEKHCPMIVDPEFTAKMEEQLDAIANGDEPEDARTQYLDEFYAGDNGLAARVKRIDDVVEAEEARRVSLPRLDAVNESSEERVSVFVGPWGPYVKRMDEGNSTTVSLPVGMAADLSLVTPQALQSLLSSKQAGGLILGQHPGDGRNIRLKTGRYGAFLQWGDDGDESTTTHSLPKGLSSMRSFDTIMTDEGNDSAFAPSLDQMLGLSLDDAVGYVNLPRTVSMLNDKPIIASIGPYGPYLKYNNTFLTLKPSDGNVLTLDSETAEELVTDRIINGKPKGALAELGEKEGAKVVVKRGRFGAYLNWKRVNAKLPKEYEDSPSEMPLDEAWSLIQSKTAPTKGKNQAKPKSSSSVQLPKGPKRPKSAYLYFCADKRSEVSSAGMSLGDVTKQLAKLWAEISSTERASYEECAAEGKAEYEKLKQEWQQECQQLTKTKKSKKGKLEKDTKDQPKRPRTAYLIFCAEHRSEVSTQKSGLGEVTKELARLWSETEDRSKYETLALEEKERNQILVT
jgi:DNA topoisomerase-1